MKKTVYIFLFSLSISLASFGFTVSAVTTAASCPNVSNGSVTATPAGGVAPYSYLVNPGSIVSSSGTFTGLPVGSYQMVVTDATGSTSAINFVINSSGITSSSSLFVQLCFEQLPFHFNDMDLNSSGTYYDTLTNERGCDSIVTLNLVVAPQLSSSVNISICTSQLPYTFEGQTYNAAGVYTQTFTSSSGCDSTSTLYLSVGTNYWSGAISTSWEEPGNWSCNEVPGPTSDVIIFSGTVVIHASTSINSLIVDDFTNLTVSPGVNFTVLH